MRPQLEREHVALVRDSELRAAFEEYVDGALLQKAEAELDDDEWLMLRCAANDAVLNEGPIVEQYWARGSFGPFPVDVKGVPGVYLVCAPDFDHEGPFPTVERAREHVEWAFVEMLCDGPDDWGDDDDDDEVDDDEDDDDGNDPGGCSRGDQR
jgi:hypothetical protein